MLLKLIAEDDAKEPGAAKRRVPHATLRRWESLDPFRRSLPLAHPQLGKGHSANSNGKCMPNACTFPIVNVPAMAS
jgi:hypothetical protein